MAAACLPVERGLSASLVAMMQGCHLLEAYALINRRVSAMSSHFHALMWMF